MKKYFKIYSLALAALMGAAVTSCTTDELSPESVIKVSNVEKNDFDKWLDANFLNPYNISFKYRYEEIEADYNYYTVPANSDQAIELAHIVKYVCIDAYDEVAGSAFVRRYFPKEFFLIGTWEYRNNGTITLGTAEGGKKILLAGVNFIDSYKKSAANLNHYYLKTIHHEFTHILNQTVSMPTAYQFVTGSSYVADAWSEEPYDIEANYLQSGFISAYSQMEYTEDFAEIMSIYVCNSQEEWDAWYEKAGTEGTALIKQKLTLVKQYMQDGFGIDLDKLRAAVQRRMNDVTSGKIDLSDLTVK